MDFHGGISHGQCNNEMSLNGVQLCILLGVGGVKTKHGPPTFDRVQLTALTCIWTRSMDSKIMGNKQLQPLQCNSRV